MPGIHILLTALLICFFPFYQSFSHAEEQLGMDRYGREYVKGEVLVKYRPSKKTDVERRARALWNNDSIETFEKSRVIRQQIPSEISIEEAVDQFRDDPDVLYVEPNYVYRQSADANDTYINSQWGLNNNGQNVGGITGTYDADINADKAWDLTTGSRNVVVAVIDSGVDYLHPDLASNIWNNSGEIEGNGIDDDGNGYVDDIHGWDFMDNDNAPMDGTGHGTHIAGIIAAAGNNTYGTAGINWNSSIMVIRFINSAGYGTTTSAIKAIEYARNNGADVINCSWGGQGYSNALFDAINNSDILFACAAGNQGHNLDNTPEYPACYNSANIISVAASDQNDRPAYFTNFSPNLVDVAAPGTMIYSTATTRETVWREKFNESNMNGWETGGTNNTWGLEQSAGALSESPGGMDYLNNTDAWAITPVFNLSEYLATRFEFNIVGTTESGSDKLLVEASVDKNSWRRLPLNVGNIMFDQVSGTLSSWKTAVADLGAFDGKPVVYVRLRFISNGSVRNDGFLIDNLSLTTKNKSVSGDNATIKQGTSMATAFVSGTAALILSKKPALSAAGVKFLIENTVDVLPSFMGKTRTSGRINAYEALVSMACVDLNATATSSSRIDLDWIAHDQVDSGFEVERRSESEAEYRSIAVLNTENHQYLDTGLNQGTTYYYRIHTLSSGVRTGYSNETYTTTLSSPFAPSASGGGGGGGGGCFIQTSILGNNQAPIDFFLKQILFIWLFPLIIVVRMMRNQPCEKALNEKVHSPF